MKFCELKILFVAGITHHESLICCEEFLEYEGQQVTVPIAPLLDFESYYLKCSINDIFFLRQTAVFSEEQFTRLLQLTFIFLVVNKT